jgi:transposase
MAELAYREVYAMNAVEARKRLVHSYQELGSIRATAQLWHTSRQVVRKWVARYQAEGEAGLEDRSRRPHTSPRQTPPAWEQAVLQARQETGLGRRRLALYLQRHGISLSPHTIRHILRRHGCGCRGVPVGRASTRRTGRGRWTNPSHASRAMGRPFTTREA